MALAMSLDHLNQHNHDDHGRPCNALIEFLIAVGGREVTESAATDVSVHGGHVEHPNGASLIGLIIRDCHGGTDHADLHRIQFAAFGDGLIRSVDRTIVKERDHGDRCCRNNHGDDDIASGVWFTRPGSFVLMGWVDAVG